MEQRITLQSVAVGVAVAAGCFYASISSGSLDVYTVSTGERNGSVLLPCTPVALTTVPHVSGDLVAVAMRDCGVLLFSGKTPISRHETPHIVLGMFGGVHAAPPPNPIAFLVSHILVTLCVRLTRRLESSVAPVLEPVVVSS